MHPLIVNQEPPLSQREEKLLSELETVIAANMRGFVLVGVALAAIRDQRLYRVQYATFEEYLLRVWDMARATAYRLIEAAEVHGNLKRFLEEGGIENVSLPENVRNCAQISLPENVTNWGQISLPENVPHGGQIDAILPANEAQARPLTMLTPEEQRVAWLDILDRAHASNGGKITANFIIQCLLARAQRQVKEQVERTKERASKAVVLPPQVQEPFMELLQAVAAENDANWDGVGRKLMVSLLEDLLATLKG